MRVPPLKWGFLDKLQRRALSGKQFAALSRNTLQCGISVEPRDSFLDTKEEEEEFNARRKEGLPAYILAWRGTHTMYIFL